MSNRWVDTILLIFPLHKPTERGRTMTILFIASFLLFGLCLLVGMTILPENCVLIGSNVPGPFMCDAFEVGKPSPCRICRDQRTALAAQLLAGFGFCLLAVPPLVSLFMQRDKNRNEPALTISGDELKRR